MFKPILKALRGYAWNRSGVAAIVFALSIPMIIASSGIAIDLATAYNAKNRLSSALDKAVLATASSTGTDDELQTRFTNFLLANYPEGKFGTPANITLTISGSVMTASASAHVPTMFMSLLGHDYIDVYQETQVVRELAGIEAVLVLDVTGSMAGTNIAALKTASTNFINTMFEKVSDVEYLRIGIVPWSTAVNIGPYGKGFDPDGGSYGAPFVDNPATDPYVTPASDIEYGTGTYDWRGCVLERDASSILTDEPSPNWPMYRYPTNHCSEYNCLEYNCAQYNCVAYNCTQYNCTRYNSRGACTRWGSTCLTYGTTCATYGTTCLVYSTTSCHTRGTTCVAWSGNPNTNCPATPVLPLTNDQAALQSKINALATQGNTYSHLGMVWGWRIVSPDFPFSEAAAYDDRRWSKTVILMTDGDNTINSVYSGEGAPGSPWVSTTVAQQNSKFAQVCANMKAEGIRIYTITFQSGINAETKSFYRNCATNSNMYYDAPSSQSLIDAFQNIADQLSQLHITK
ncbi:MAG: TadE/TadG family type IV pilus assembly protein [Pseudomonadota bacterium]